MATTDTKAKRNKPAARDRILAAAEVLFADQGVHRTQVSDIVRQASTGTGTFYNHFDDKFAVLDALVHGFAEELRSRLKALRAPLTVQTPAEHFVTIHQSFTLFFTSIFARPNMARILFGMGAGASDDAENIARGFIADFCQDLVDDIERIEQARLAHVPDKDLVALAIAGIAVQVGNAMVLQGDLDPVRAVRACTTFVAGGLSMYTPDERWQEVLPALRTLTTPVH